MKRVLVSCLAVLFALAACAPAKPLDATAMSSAYISENDSPLRHSVEVGEIKGENADKLTKAVEISLETNKFLVDEKPGKYRINVELVKLDEVIEDTQVTATSTLKYSLVDIRDSNILVESEESETVTLQYSGGRQTAKIVGLNIFLASMAVAFGPGVQAASITPIEYKKLRGAKQRAISANLSKMVKELTLIGR